MVKYDHLVTSCDVDFQKDFTIFDSKKIGTVSKVATLEVHCLNFLNSVILSQHTALLNGICMHLSLYYILTVELYYIYTYITFLVLPECPAIILSQYVS